MNGVPSCANDFTLQTILRDSYDFDGFVVTDCGALDAILYDHNYTSTVEETVAVALHAGVDLNCGVFLQNHSVPALASGAIVESDIDRALTNSISVLVRTGWFDPAENQPYRQLGPEAVNTPEARELALQAAIEGFVLLQNSGPSPLPWNLSETGTVAVLGPLRNATDVMQGNYQGQAPFLIDPVTALQTAGVNVIGSMGMDSVTSNDTSGFAAALASIASADAVIYIGGLDQTVECEGNDRTDIGMPGVQEEFLAQILQATQQKGVQLVTIIMSGGQVDLSVVQSSAAAASSSKRDDSNSPQASEGSSILWVGYPGQAGGTAIAMTLFGLNGASPAGRLPLTQYPASYTSQVSMFDMSFRPSLTNPGRTYKFFPSEQAVFEFGTGLSYTEFEYRWGGGAGVKQQEMVHSRISEEDGVEEITIDSFLAVHSADRLAPALSYRVNVTNTGVLSSDVVVLLFLLPSGDEIASALLDGAPVPPNKQLVGFERVQMVAPGETEEVFFAVQARQLTRVNAAGEKWLRPGSYHFGVDVPTKRQWTIRLSGQPRRLE
jgi:beta-D-xylosidase 4